MSEKVKLIIEIPKDYYEIIKHEVENHLTDYRTFEIIGNGIPLDDVKAEIRELRDSWEKDCYHDEAEALNIALKIIDKHIGKENKE